MKLSWHKITCFILSFFLLIIFLPSCKKDFRSSIPVSSQDAIPAFPLAWETADYMPSPSGTTILVPWANGSVKGFSSDIWYDFKTIDGWELVYNVFNTSSLPANPWFALYNRYRGLLRIYVYVTSNGFQSSTYLTSGLNLSPNAVNSSLLNFVGQDIVDLSANKASISRIEPTQIATGTWYASEYEMAYDPNIAASTYEQLGLNWTLKWTNVTQMTLGGAIQGTIKGTITTPASGGFNLAGNAQSGAFYLTGESILSANKGSDPAHPENNNGLGLPSFVFKSIESGLSSGLQGVIKNIGSAIFGGNSANTQQVSMNVNAQITLNGSSTSGGAIFPDPGLGIGIPGISNSQSAAGYVPLFNAPMGVFNLMGKPIINRHTDRSQGPEYNGIPYNRYATEYTVNTSNFNSLFILNPSVINSATAGAALQNLRTTVLVLNPETASDYYFQAFGINEQIGSYNVYSGNPVVISYDVEHSSYPMNNLLP